LLAAPLCFGGQKGAKMPSSNLPNVDSRGATGHTSSQNWWHISQKAWFTLQVQTRLLLILS